MSHHKAQKLCFMQLGSNRNTQSKCVKAAKKFLFCVACRLQTLHLQSLSFIFGLQTIGGGVDDVVQSFWGKERSGMDGMMN